MINVDNVNKINFVANSHKLDLISVLKNILIGKCIELNIKEITSHILSAALGFCENVSVEDESIYTILNWTKDHHILK